MPRIFWQLLPEMISGLSQCVMTSGLAGVWFLDAHITTSDRQTDVLVAVVSQSFVKR